MILLNVVVPEGGTIVFVASFKDTTGAVFTPKTITYSVTSTTGAVINNKWKVTVAPSGSTQKFVLYGADTAIAPISASTVNRVFTIEGTYDSVDGTDLPFRQEAQFTITNTVVQP